MKNVYYLAGALEYFGDYSKIVITHGLWRGRLELGKGEVHRYGKDNLGSG